jgi:hypothetical protein
VLGAPVVEGEQPVPDLAFAWDGAGDPGPQVEHVSSPGFTSRSKKAGVPPVREQSVLSGLLVDGEAGPAAAVFIDTQVRHRRRVLVQHGIGSKIVGAAGSRITATRP